MADGQLLAELWRSLVTGAAEIVESFATRDRYGLLLASRRGASATPLTERHRAVLEDVLLGSRQKVVALDMELASSSVAGILKHALSAIGLACLPSRVPLLLVVAAHAARVPSKKCPVLLRQEGGKEGGKEAAYRSVSLHAPRAWLTTRLTPCESRVASLRIEGKSHVEIGALCGVAARTVANQLASAYEKLRLGGRQELLSRLAHEYLLGNVPSHAGFLGPV